MMKAGTRQPATTGRKPLRDLRAARSLYTTLDDQEPGLRWTAYQIQCQRSWRARPRLDDDGGTPPFVAHKLIQPTFHAAGGSPTQKPRRFRRTNCFARPADPRERPKDQRTIPHAYGHRTQQGLSHKLYLAPLPCVQDSAENRTL